MEFKYPKVAVGLTWQTPFEMLIVELVALQSLSVSKLPLVISSEPNSSKSPFRTKSLPKSVTVSIKPNSLTLVANELRVNVKSVSYTHLTLPTKRIV